MKPSQWKFFFAALVDFIASVISFFALKLMPLSIFFMIRGSSIIFASVFSVIFLKRKLYRHHILGLIITILGTIMLGLFAILNSDNNTESDNLLVGIILIIISFIFGSFHLVLEELFFDNTFLNAF